VDLARALDERNDETAGILFVKRCHMSSDVNGVDEYVDGILAGQCAVVAALVVALHETGVLPKDQYAAALNRLWIGMPDEEAAGEAGAVIERVLDLLSARAYTADPPDDAAGEQAVSARAGKPVIEEAAARPAATALRALLHAFRGRRTTFPGFGVSNV
jgi:hypothetical protein